MVIPGKVNVFEFIDGEYREAFLEITQEETEAFLDTDTYPRRIEDLEKFIAERRKKHIDPTMKPNRLLPILFAASLSLTNCTDSAKEPEIYANTIDVVSVTHVDAIAASQLLSSNPDIVVLDVRTPAEHAEGHLPGKVVNVDFKADNFREQAAKLDRDTAYLVHCRSGGRSTSSLEILEALGFKTIHHLDGGVMAWTESGEVLEK